MKVTKDNIESIDYIVNKDYCINYKTLLEALLIDIDEINNMLHNKNMDYMKIYIDYNDKHTEYSPERVDPCPDFYGSFSVRLEHNQYEKIGCDMDIEMLDSNLCTIYNFVENMIKNI